MRFYLKTIKNDERPIFITGNFNNWNPRDKEYCLQKTKEEYYIEIDNNKLPGEIEYKFTKGGWENVEIDCEGHFTSNRKVKKSAKAVHDVVDAWRWNWAPFKEQYFPDIELISEHFYIPQLDKTRKVWALLPYDYKSSKRDTLFFISRMHKIYSMKKVYTATGKSTKAFSSCRIWYRRHYHYRSRTWK